MKIFFGLTRFGSIEMLISIFLVVISLQIDFLMAKI